MTVIKRTADNLRLSRASSQMSQIRSERGNFTPDKKVVNVYRLLDLFKHHKSSEHLEKRTRVRCYQFEQKEINEAYDSLVKLKTRQYKNVFAQALISLFRAEKFVTIKEPLV